MYQAIGVKSKKIYATGARSDCLRELDKSFPYKTQEGRKNTIYKGIKVLPEPMMIVRKG